MNKNPFNIFQAPPTLEDILTWHYNLYLIILSYVVVCIASSIAFDVIGSLRKPSSHSFFGRLLGGAFAMGSGIFAAHYIGLIAFFNLKFNLLLVLLSLALGVFFSFLSFYLLLKLKRKKLGIFLCSLTLSVAIGIVFFLSMRSIIQITTSFHPGLFALSFAVAVIGSFMSIAIFFISYEKQEEIRLIYKILSSLLMGGAILGMHYVGMKASIAVPFSLPPDVKPHFTIAHDVLVLLTAFVVSLFMVVALITRGYRHLILIKLLIGYIIISLILLAVGSISIGNLNEVRYYSSLIEDTYFPEAIRSFERYQSLDEAKTQVAKTLGKATQILNLNLALVKEFTLIILLTIAAVVAISIILSWLLSFQISKPILRLRDASQEVAHGNLLMQVHQISEDEIGQLTKAFNVMINGLAEYREKLELISQLSQGLLNSKNLEEIYEMFSSFASRLLPFYSGFLFVTNKEDKNELQLVSHWGEANSFCTHIAAKQCLALVRSDTFQGSSLRALHCEHAASDWGNYLCIPLWANEVNIGLFTVVFKLEKPSNLEEKVIKRVAADISLAISSILLKDTLQELSIIDPLTGLYNRRYMEESLKAEIERAKTQETALSIIIFDIDKFKQINDFNGHIAGDRVLSETSKVLRGHFRKNDIICRYGGDEFLVIMLDAEKEEVLKRASYICHILKNLPIDVGARTLEGLSISAGVAFFAPHYQDLESLIDAADKMLYQAKGDGGARAYIVGQFE